MPDLLPLTGAAIADYRQHMSQHPDTDPVILAYLNRHINGLMCAEIEQVVTRLICEKLDAGQQHPEARSFFPSFLDARRMGCLRNARVDEMRTTLSAFGLYYRNKFNELLDGGLSSDDINKLNAAVKKRNEDAHSTPPTITFQEVEETYDVATAVMDAVQQTLQT